MALPLYAKVNQMLQAWPSGTVGLAAWLKKQGVSRQLLRQYQKSGWLEAIGRGAYKRAGDTVDWTGGLYALQHQASMDIHVGARTALGMLGQAHYLELNQKVAQLFGPRSARLPEWFATYDWGLNLDLHKTDFLPENIGLVDVESKLFTIKASEPARALMECLYLAPEKYDLIEGYEIMEGLGGLRPDVVQQLLQECRSVKVTRLFLFMAEQAGHTWVKYLDFQKIDMGKGKRSLVRGGDYVSKYQITVPKGLITQ